MLIGQFEGRISEKFQVAFPKRFRDVLGDTVIITKGFENCLIIVSQENWKTLLEGTTDKPFIDKNSRELQRFLLGNATQVELDSKGRFVLPEYLREYARLQEDIVFAGIGRFVEVWNKVDWQSHQKELATRVESISERIQKNNE